MKGHKKRFLLSLWVAFTILLLLTIVLAGNFAFKYFQNALTVQIIAGNEAVAQKFKEDIEELKNQGLDTENILKTIQGKIEGFSLSETGFACILDSTGKVIAHPVKDLIGMDVSQNKIYSLKMEKEYSLGELLKAKKEATGIFSTPTRIDIVANIPLPELSWRVSVHEIKEKVDKEVGYLRRVLFLIGSIFYLVVVSISYPVLKRLISGYESELNKYACTLEQRVDERTKELKESQRKTQEYAEHIAILNRITQVVNSSLQFSEVYDALIREGRRLIDFDYMNIALLEEKSETLKTISLKGSQRVSNLWEERTLPLKGSASGWVILNRRPYISGDLEKDGRIINKHLYLAEGLCSTLVVPLLSKGGKAIGTLNIASKRLDAYSKVDAEVLLRISDQLVQPLENMQLLSLLKSEKSKMKSLIENMAEGVILLNENSMIEIINRLGKEFLQCITMKKEGDPLLHLLEFPSFKEELNNVLNGKKTNGEIEILSFPGKDRIFSVTISPVRLKTKEVKGVVIVCREVTKERALQEQLLQAEKLSLLGVLIAGVAHELNNPLYVIGGNAELLLMEKDLGDKFKSYVEDIVKGASRATKIIQNLLTFSRKHKAEKSIVNINELLDQTLALRDYDIKTSNIEVVKELEISTPKTEANPNQLQQVFLNLINNAIDEMAMCQGRRTLTIKSKKEDKRIMVSFTDTGRGIPVEKVGKIFDPFYTTKEIGQGTGLGLSISMGIVKEHGGNISVKSSEDKGTTFTVELPLLKGDEPLVKKSLVSDAISHRRKGSILVVDDEKMVLDFVKRVLEKVGYKVDGVTEGYIAQERLKKELFDLIISDIRMPGLSGIDLYYWVVRDKPELARRFVFLTGDVARAETREFLEGIENLYIEKPVEIEGLLKTIDTALQNVEIDRFFQIPHTRSYS